MWSLGSVAGLCTLLLLVATPAALSNVADPVAPAYATVIFDRARFTLLTPALIRMELKPPGAASDDSGFDDRATFAVINRRPPVAPSYYVNYPDPNTVLISTDLLRLTFRRPSSSVVNFTADNLHIDFNVAGKATRWTPDMQDQNNLNGTCDRAPPGWPGGLDCYSNPTECLQQYFQRWGQGLISRSGWAVHDDTYTPRFETKDPAPGELRWLDLTSNGKWSNSSLRLTQDLYFLGHGHDYKQALQDWSLVSGPILMPPQSAFGVWWSRYYPYSAEQFLKEVLIPFQENDLPLNHAVLDMDWHIEPQNVPGCSSWGGYTFNTTLFPDPKGFIEFLHSYSNVQGHPLKLSVNLHPQTGLDHCQALYPQVACAIGVNPATQATIPCNLDNQTLSDVMYKLVLDAEPLAGIDYWWTDYGGCSASLNDIQAQWWTNYVYVEHMNVVRQTRPLVLSRYGGLGSQRLPIGFSGDTFQDYGTLMFEIRMTPTSSNVLFAYWSHDIGGNHNGTDCPGTDNPNDLFGMELLVRWMQFAAVSPIWRTHCGCERKFWTFPYFDLMKQAFQLRNALGPYIYTAARTAYETAIGILHPTYYEWPEEDAAYEYLTQYMFGDEVLAAPISDPTDDNGLVVKDIWIPPGLWVSWNGETVYQGPSILSAMWTRADLPLFAKAGAVIPLKTMSSVNTLVPADPIMWVLFNLRSNTLSGSGKLYEDDGISLNYQLSSNSFTWTELNYKTTSSISGVETVITIDRTGTFSGAPAMRRHVLQLRGGQAPQSITCNGEIVPPGSQQAGWYLITETARPMLEPVGALVVALPSLPTTEPIVVIINW